MQEAILVPSHFFSHTLSDVQNNSKTYVKELLQINDIIILPHTQQKKKLETLTDKVTYRVQQHMIHINLNMIFYTRTHACTHARTHAPTHARTHTHTHTHMPTVSLSPSLTRGSSDILHICIVCLWAEDIHISLCLCLVHKNALMQRPHGELRKTQQPGDMSTSDIAREGHQQKQNKTKSWSLTLFSPENGLTERPTPRLNKQTKNKVLIDDD